MSKKVKLILKQMILFLSILVLWELVVRVGIANEFLISKPTSIVRLLFEYFENGEIYKHIYISVFETLLGIVIGSTLGVIIASLMWYFDKYVEIINPLLVILNALPKTALAPIIIIWAGTGVTGIV